MAAPTILITDDNTNVNQMASFQPASVGVLEENYPVRPNHYDDFCRERKRKKIEADLRRQLEERQMKERKRYERERDEKENDLNISDEEGWRITEEMGGPTPPAPRSPSPPGNIVDKSENKQLAEKRIMNIEFNMAPTRVLLLRNMVGPGEVDDELEFEVAEECTKFGTVINVLILEITEPNFPHEEAVRIFVELEISEQATEALIELEGRFFRGRIVRAGFYEEEKFNKKDLLPAPGEIPGFT